jgi:protein-disulfide isomerase
MKIEYRSLETATREPEIFKTQQVAAYAAGKQNKAWNFIETFYHEQGEEDSGYVTEKYIQNIASQVPGLNLAQWSSDRGSQELANQVTVTDAQAASNAGFNGTPSFLIGHTGSTVTKVEYSNPEEPGFINEAVEKLLKA